MGRLQKEELQRIFADHDTDRIGVILDQEWADPEALKVSGFKVIKSTCFTEFGIDFGQAYDSHKFMFGTWHGKQVIISQGRVCLGENQPSMLRRWMSVLIALMGNSRRIVIMGSASGISTDAEVGTFVLPRGLISAHIPQPYLCGVGVKSEHLLWDYHEESGQSERWREYIFSEALSGTPHDTITNGLHMLIPGPGYGGVCERQLWQSQNVDTVSCSLDPELRLIALERMDNDPYGHNPEKDIRVFATLYVTDDQDDPKQRLTAEQAETRSNDIAEFLSKVLSSSHF